MSKTPKLRRNPRSYPFAARDAVSIDYHSKLTEEEKDFLSKFNEAEFGGNPDVISQITGSPISTAERRKKWVTHKRLQRDALNHHTVSDQVVEYRPRSTVSHQDTLNELIDLKNELLNNKQMENIYNQEIDQKVVKKIAKALKKVIK